MNESEVNNRIAEVMLIPCHTPDTPCRFMKSNDTTGWVVCSRCQYKRDRIRALEAERLVSDEALRGIPLST